MADGPIWWPKPPGRPTGSPAPYWNLENVPEIFEMSPEEHKPRGLIFKQTHLQSPTKVWETVNCNMLPF